MLPVMTAGWFWKLPLLNLQDHVMAWTGVALSPGIVMKSSLNIEFNNMSGIFAPLMDFGPFIGLVVWGVLGFTSGRLYRAFRSGRIIGLLLFPTWYVGLLEIPRVFYWGDSRYFPALAVSILIFLVARIVTRTDPAWNGRSSSARG